MWVKNICPQNDATGLPWWLSGKDSNAGDTGLLPGPERSQLKKKKRQNDETKEMNIMAVLTKTRLLWTQTSKNKQRPQQGDKQTKAYKEASQIHGSNRREK